MPAKIKWLVEKYVIEGEYSGHVTIDDITIASSQAIMMMEQTDTERIHILIDLTHTESVETNLARLRKVSGSLFQHPQLGWFIVAGISSPVVHLMATMLAQIFRHRYKSTRTREEAIQLLEGLDARLKQSE